MKKIAWFLGAGLLALIVVGEGALFLMFREHPMGGVERSVRSRDGTTIAFEQAGAGRPIVLVGAALADRGGTGKLGQLLSRRFTVINYDRRGRGKSTDTSPYAVQREVEDIDSLIDAAGGSAYLFGSSSGAVLALEAASRLGTKVRGLFLYEPPFIIDSSRAPMPAGFAQRVERLVAEQKRDEAVRVFFTDGVGVPGPAVTLMRVAMPGWQGMTRIAHTIGYDLAVLDGTQAGTRLPVERWQGLAAPALVMVGSRSEAFFHTGAKALAGSLPKTQYRVLEGGDHSSVMIGPRDLAAAIEGWFGELEK